MLLAILFGVLILWAILKVCLEILKLSWSLVLTVGGILLCPIILVGVFASEILIGVGVIVIIGLLIASIFSVM